MIILKNEIYYKILKIILKILQNNTKNMKLNNYIILILQFCNIFAKLNKIQQNYCV